MSIKSCFSCLPCFSNSSAKYNVTNSPENDPLLNGGKTRELSREKNRAVKLKHNPVSLTSLGHNEEARKDSGIGRTSTDTLPFSPKDLGENLQQTSDIVATFIGNDISLTLVSPFNYNIQSGTDSRVCIIANSVFDEIRPNKLIFNWNGEGFKVEYHLSQNPDQFFIGSFNITSPEIRGATWTFNISPPTRILDQRVNTLILGNMFDSEEYVDVPLDDIGDRRLEANPSTKPNEYMDVGN